MRALVTGASGFIGRALAERLLHEGWDVRVLARDPRRVVGLAGAEVVEGDLTDAAAVDRAVEGVDVVFNVAGAFREPGLPDERYRQVNVQAVGHVIAAARRHGVRRVDFFTNERRYDTGKARRLLGFRPGVRPEDGLVRTAAWYREQGLLPHGTSPGTQGQEDGSGKRKLTTVLAVMLALYLIVEYLEGSRAFTPRMVASELFELAAFMVVGTMVAALLGLRGR